HSTTIPASSQNRSTNASVLRGAPISSAYTTPETTKVSWLQASSSAFLAATCSESLASHKATMTFVSSAVVISSSCPRSSRSHFCMAFRPFPIPGLPIPIYFAKGLSFRTAFTYFFAPAIDNPPYPEYLAHLCNGKVKNHRIPKRSQKAALKRGLAQGPKFR